MSTGLGSELEDPVLRKDGDALGVWGTKGKERWRGRPFSRLARIPTSMHTAAGGATSQPSRK